MPWNSLTNLTTGQLVTETHLDQIRENIEHLGTMKAQGTALSALSASTEINTPAYDSGWFAVSQAQTYTKAHGLSAHPKQVEVWHSTTATPTTSDELVLVTFTALGGQEGIGADGTNIYIRTGVSYTVNNQRRLTNNSGFYRIYAWR
jgi:hypothetical protein